MDTRRSGGGGRAAVAGLVLLVLLLLVAGAAFVRWPLPAGLAQRLAAERLGRPVSIEGGWFRLAPRPSAHVDAIVVGPPEGGPAGRFARAEDVDLTLAWGTLFGGRPHVVSLSAARGDVLLHRDRDGRANWRVPQAGGTAGTDAPDGRGPIVDRLELGEFAVRLVDETRAADLRGTVSLSDGSGRVGPSDEAGVRVDARGRLGDRPVRIEVRGGSVLSGAEAVPVAGTARVGDAELRFDGSVAEPSTLGGLDGDLSLRGASLGTVGALVGVLLPATPSFTLDGRLRRDGARWTLAIAEARIGASDLRGELAYRTASGDRPARLDGRLASARMRLADLGRSVGFGAGPGRRGRVLPDVPLDLPRLRGMDADVRVAIERLEVPALAPIREVAARLRLSEGVLALGELEADLAGGRLAGEIRIDGRPTPGALRTRLAARGVALRRWLPELGGAPALDARMNAELELRGRGDTVADVLAGSGGHLRVAIGPGRASGLLVELAGLDVAESLAALGSDDRAVRLDCAVANLGIARGVARPEPLFVDTSDTLVAAQGTIDLSTERLDLTLRASPRDASPLSVRAPIRVRGSFAEPSVGVDRARVAGTVVASVLLGALVTPVAALLPLLDFGEGDTPSPCRERLAQLPREPRSGAKAGAR